MKSAVCLTSSARKFIFIMWGIAILSFHLLQTRLHCALSLAAQCIVIGPVCLCVRLCVCGLVYLFVCGSVTTITRNWCIDLHKTGLVGSDRLQLIKFWPSRAPGKGVCGGAKFLAPPYYRQHAVFVSHWPLFHYCLLLYISPQLSLRAYVSSEAVILLIFCISSVSFQCLQTSICLPSISW